MKPKLGKKNPNYKQGIFKPTNPLKYKGSFPVVYRSGLELQVFRWMDGWLDGWMDGLLAGWMDEWIDGWLAVGGCFCGAAAFTP